ncbi:uncharacterized protein DDB_G0271670-like [Mizuhopecten yessoensis]|uniref:uncharacterized protein DDB_G0271670-like n=1 Tax=Mizuhopecten yessoensis TaxID=6573 RepID=UPI000B45B3EA|nr:uncharacterized protein DDB_G0271670-like [Mizuhopecten yessoensis]
MPKAKDKRILSRISPTMSQSSDSLSGVGYRTGCKKSQHTRMHAETNLRSISDFPQFHPVTKEATDSIAPVSACLLSSDQQNMSESFTTGKRKRDDIDPGSNKNPKSHQSTKHSLRSVTEMVKTNIKIHRAEESTSSSSSSSSFVTGVHDHFNSPSVAGTSQSRCAIKKETDSHSLWSFDDWTCTSSSSSSSSSSSFITERNPARAPHQVVIKEEHISDDQRPHVEYEQPSHRQRNPARAPHQVVIKEEHISDDQRPHVEYEQPSHRQRNPARAPQQVVIKEEPISDDQRPHIEHEQTSHRRNNKARDNDLQYNNKERSKIRTTGHEFPATKNKAGDDNGQLDTQAGNKITTNGHKFSATQ